MTHSIKRIKIAVSSCLLGKPVRYDGNHKENKSLKVLCDRFECVSICPECEIGLGVPRPPIHIVNVDEHFRARGKTNPNFDVTQSLETLATEIATNNNSICGYVFKARSPSCGINSAPWYSASRQESGITSGIFSSRIQQLLPALPVIEETQFEKPKEMKSFIAGVKEYAAAAGDEKG
jgi:uncharacterized protein YbbK (DUF523 family)